MPRPVDPLWKEISASLRAGYLYVKMPRTTARRIAFILQLECKQGTKDSSAVAKFLTDLVTQGIDFSIYFSLTIPAAGKEMETLAIFEDALVKNYVRVLQAGLDNDPAVDWITRVGGPGANPSPSFEMEPL